jgi:hypothetical protein
MFLIIPLLSLLPRWMALAAMHLDTGIAALHAGASAVVGDPQNRSNHSNSST